MFICEMWLFHWYFLYSANLICRSMDFSKCFRESLRLRDNESRLYITQIKMSVVYVTVRRNVKFWCSIIFILREVRP